MNFNRILIRPYTEKLLDRVEGKRVLDIGCGNGDFSRRLYDLDARVTVVDYSKVMIDRAK